MRWVSRKVKIVGRRVTIGDSNTVPGLFRIMPAHKVSLKSERTGAHEFHEFAQIKVEGYGKDACMG